MQLQIKKDITLLLVIVAFQLTLKFSFISNESLWSDEAASIAYSLPYYSELISTAFQTAVPPGYYLILHNWINFFGESEFFVRLLSVLFSSLSAVLIFTFAKKFLNLQTAMLSSIFFLLSNFNLYYAQEARPYSMVLFLSLCSFFLFFEFLKNPTILKTIGLAVISFLLIFTHYIAVFIPVVQGVAVLGVAIKSHLGKFPFFPIRPVPPYAGALRDGDLGVADKWGKNTLRFFIFSMVLTFLMFAPWLKYVVKNFTMVGDTWLAPPTLSQFKWVFIEFAGNKTLAFMFIALALFSVGWLVCEFWMGNISDNKRGVETLHATSLHSRFLVFLSARLNLNYLLILLLWAFLPVILGYIISQYNAVFYPRYYLYSSVGLYLFLAYLFSAVNIKIMYKALIFAPIVIYSAFTIDLSPSKGEDWKHAVLEIAKERETITPPSGGQGGAIIIISAWYQYRPFTYYYNREYFRDYGNTIELLKKENIHCIDKADGLEKINLEPFTKIILVQSHQPVADPENTLYKYFSGNYKFEKIRDYEGIKISVFGRQ